ncbi:MAG TPA: hypothetical protein VIU11_03735 [Nakamurella sp.]
MAASSRFCSLSACACVDFVSAFSARFSADAVRSRCTDVPNNAPAPAKATAWIEPKIHASLVHSVSDVPTLNMRKTDDTIQTTMAMAATPMPTGVIFVPPAFSVVAPFCAPDDGAS